MKGVSPRAEWVFGD